MNKIERFIVEHWDDMTTKEMKRKLKLGRYIIHKLARGMGLNINRKIEKFSEEDKKYIKDNWKNKSQKDIAKILKKCPKSIHDVVKNMGLPSKKNLKETERNKRQKYILDKYGGKFFKSYPKKEIGRLCSKLNINRRTAEMELVAAGLYHPVKAENRKKNDKYIIDNWEKINIKTIAKNLGISRSTIWKHVKQLSLPPKNRKGTNSGKWKGGCCHTNKSKMNAIRKSIRGSRWENSVRLRDGIKCKKCNKLGKRNKYYQIVGVTAHHIYNFYDYPDKRFDINNGITLCIKCHERFHHKYGYRHTNKNQITRFIKND